MRILPLLAANKISKSEIIQESVKNRRVEETGK